MRSVDESANGKTVDLAVGDLLEVRLTENRTTGFRWELTLAPDSETACAAEDDAAASQAAAPGQGGTHTWRFKALRAGDCDIRLANRRSWEAAGAAAETFTLHLHVTA